MSRVLASARAATVLLPFLVACESSETVILGPDVRTNRIEVEGHVLSEADSAGIPFAKVTLWGEGGHFFFPPMDSTTADEVGAYTITADLPGCGFRIAASASGYGPTQPASEAKQIYCSSSAQTVDIFLRPLEPSP